VRCRAPPQPWGGSEGQRWRRWSYQQVARWDPTPLLEALEALGAASAREDGIGGGDVCSFMCSRARAKKGGMSVNKHLRGYRKDCPPPASKAVQRSAAQSKAKQRSTKHNAAVGARYCGEEGEGFRSRPKQRETEPPRRTR
jgi:hypothetical protein